MPSEPPERQISSWYAWSETAFVLWLYYLLITIAIAVPPFVLPELGYYLNLREGTAVTLAGTLLAEAVAFILLLWWMRRRGLTLRELGLITPYRRSPVIFAIAFALAYAGWTFQIPDVAAHALEISLFKAWGVFVAVIGAFVEEIIFRGFLMTELDRAGRSRFEQVVLSTITFGLLHIGFGLWGILCTIVMGAVLSVTYLWSGRSLVAPILAHALINTLIEPWLLLSVITFYARMFNPG